jgi:hypothetical protein
LHFTSLGTIEYFGEDEPWVEFIAATFNRHVSTGSWRSAIEVLVSGWHPPVRYLVSAAGIALFGANEFGGRVFHASSGIAIFFALRWIVGAAWPPARPFVLLLYAVTGPAVLHRINGGHGLFIAFVLWTFILLEQAERRRSGGRLVAAAMLLVLAVFTSYEGLVFYPYAVWWLWRLRRVLRPARIALTGGVLLAPLALLAGIFFARGGDVQGLGLGQLTMRLGTATVGPTWNLGQKTALYISAMGPLYAALLLLALMGILRALWRGTASLPAVVGRLALFHAPHAIAWLVILPGPMSHTLWDYPVWTTLTGWVWAGWATRRRWVGPMFAAACAVTGLLTFEAFNRLGEFSNKPITRLYATMNVPACPSSERWGQRALARMLDDRIGRDEAIVTSFGGSLPIAYLRRPIRGEYRQVLAAARAGGAPADPSITAIVLHSFSPDFEAVQAAFPFARTRIPAIEREGPAFLVVWFALPGDRLVPLDDMPAVRVAAGRSE